ncbi:hypothetical protein [Streptomyces sp. NPDC029674]|uniref:hypothetical protein n=1 Tax=Streptomyces sp. NPDC029674 TaxID=3365297 RepID=UPI00384DD494
METTDNVVAGDGNVQAVRRWVRLSCTEPGTHLPALAEIAADLRLPTAVQRRHDEAESERAYRLLRTAIHRSYEPGERFMTRYDIGQHFDIGGKEAAAAVRQLIAEGLLTGPRGQYVNAFSPQQQRRRVKQLRERASQLRREALELMRTAREIEQELPTGGDTQET